MADIISYKARRRGSPDLAGESNGPAEIIIFPGVRIERENFSLADRVKPSAALGGKQAKPQRQE